MSLKLLQMEISQEEISTVSVPAADAKDSNVVTLATFHAEISEMKLGDWKNIKLMSVAEDVSHLLKSPANLVA